jgi:hypothetical protein
MLRLRREHARIEQHDVGTIRGGMGRAAGRQQSDHSGENKYGSMQGRHADDHR